VERSIWKFKLRETDKQEVEMPANARVLSAGIDPSGELVVWALCDQNAPKVVRVVAVLGTSNPYWPDESAKFIGTVLQSPFVWHVFDLGERCREGRG